MVEPAEACTEIPHPNLAALRSLDGDAVVAFVSEADFAGEAEDKFVAALLAEIRRGR
jgi:hypothetical protein